VSKSTAIAGMVSLPASDRSHLHQPQKPAVSNLHRQEQPRPPSKTTKSGHRSNRGLTTKTPLRRSEAGAEQSSLSRDSWRFRLPAEAPEEHEVLAVRGLEGVLELGDFLAVTALGLGELAG
jgi:hypothetical protein